MCSTRGGFNTCIGKIKIHSSCEIEDFVETHVCKLPDMCDTPIRYLDKPLYLVLSLLCVNLVLSLLCVALKPLTFLE